MDTHALSEPAFSDGARGACRPRGRGDLRTPPGKTPTPAVSHAILTWNRGRDTDVADGIVVTPSHNPPEDGGFKYNPPHGGPADTDITGWIQSCANELLRNGNRGVKRVAYDSALKAPTTHQRDLVGPYVDDLRNVIDMDAIRSAGLKLGVDPLGGSSLPIWEPIAIRYGLDLTIVNRRIDPRFAFMTVDHDGKIRMDCSSPYAMAGLVGLVEGNAGFDIAWGNDPDADRHGIVTRSAGLMNPNHYLAAAIQYLLGHRPDWPQTAVVGKTLVSSGIIDRVVKNLDRTLWEVPVGFKWFSPGLFDGSCCFGGEESAGASFLRRNGSAWTTDKDGLILGLLAAEITAKSGRDPGEMYRDLVREFGEPAYERIDMPADAPMRAWLGRVRAEEIRAKELAGEPVEAVLYARSRQWRADRRGEGDREERVVRGAALGHRRPVEAVRGKLFGA